MLRSLVALRIKILGPVEVQVENSNERKEESKPESKPEKKNMRKKWGRKLKFAPEETPDSKEGVELDGGVVGGDGGVADEKGEGSKPRIIMVRTENLKHDPFEQTQELKVSWCFGGGRSCDLHVTIMLRLFLLRSSKLFVTSLL